MSNNGRIARQCEYSLTSLVISTCRIKQIYIQLYNKSLKTTCISLILAIKDEIPPTSYRSVRGQGQHPYRGLQLQFIGCRVATVTAGNRSDLDVKLLGLIIIEIRVAGVKISFLLLSSTTQRAMQLRSKSRHDAGYVCIHTQVQRKNTHGHKQT